MVKKIVGLLVALAMIMICSIPVFAANGDSTTESSVPDSTQKADDKKSDGKDAEKTAEPKYADKNQQLIDKILRDADANENNTGLVTLKKPESATLTIFKDSYTISGESDAKSVKVYLAKYSDGQKAYLPFANNDGETSWDIGSYGKFAKSILLSKGANQFKLVSAKVSDTDELKAEDVQVTKFTITYLEKNLKDKLIKGVQDGIKDFGDALGNLFKEKK